ncbi:hypothetical protein OQA88_9852 [Cercophora sp. LCS_1]
MAPVKRKRLHDATTTSEPHHKKATVSSIPIAHSPAISRRTTRSIAPPPIQQPELPQRRRRGNTNGPVPMNARPPELPRGKENIPMEHHQHSIFKSTRLTRHSGSVAPPASVVAADIHKPGSALTPVPVPVFPLPSERETRPQVRDTPKVPAPVNGRQTARPVAPLVHQHSVGRSKPIIMATSGTQRRHSPTPEQNGRRGSGQDPHKQKQESDRNIDKVVLGDICFSAWYPSYYGKEVLGDTSSAHHTTKGAKVIPVANGTGGSKDDISGGKAHGRRDRDNPPVLDRLYVCPVCFKYSKELVAWREHVRACEERGHIPGTKIYVHPKGCRKVPVPSGPTAKSGRGKRPSGGQKIAVEEVIQQDEGEWSVWEVDGAEDVLFCQNLSLFAKLFLDNKSVFFDVTGFNYFLLVYTPSPTRTSEIASSTHPRIVGFFSKEKISWDNNNLACILVFPPWQRKGLGALLMGVSYEISRRECVLGGPEKPISDLGKKGYKRFWAGEIARWFLGLETKDEQETLVDVNECSQATWIAPDDCLLVLREMGVVEEAGLGKRKFKELEPDTESEEVVEEVKRVRVSKEGVRDWIARNKVGLERTCDPNGFVDGYAIPKSPVEEA